MGRPRAMPGTMRMRHKSERRYPRRHGPASQSVNTEECACRKRCPHEEMNPPKSLPTPVRHLRSITRSGFLLCLWFNLPPWLSLSLLSLYALCSRLSSASGSVVVGYHRGSISHTPPFGVEGGVGGRGPRLRRESSSHNDAVKP